MRDPDSNLIATAPPLKIPVFASALSDHVGFTTAETDSVILAWEAKTQYNRARPTQFVNDENNGYSDTINSWDGMGFGPIAASQWDAMIRVMPHAEYVSGSGCICTAVAQYIARYAAVEHSLAAFKTHLKVGPGDNMNIGVSGSTELVFHSMTELRDACGSVCFVVTQNHCVSPALRILRESLLARVWRLTHSPVSRVVCTSSQRSMTHTPSATTSAPNRTTATRRSSSV